jgi:hypothetical protein
MKYKFILHWFFTPRNRSGNVSSYFALADTRSGRIIHGHSAPESNLRGVIFELNGGEHKQNYWFAQTQIPSREFNYRTKDIDYIGCDPAVIAAAFRKAMKSRKRRA